MFDHQPFGILGPKKQTPSVDISSVATPIYKFDVYEFTTNNRKRIKTHMGHKHKELLRDEIEEHSLELSLLNQKRQEENDSSLLANSTVISVSEEDKIVKNNTIQGSKCNLNFLDKNQINDHKKSEHSIAGTPVKYTREEDIITNQKCQCENMHQDDNCVKCFYCWDCCDVFNNHNHSLAEALIKKHK